MRNLATIGFLLSLWFSPWNAQATILWAGGEDVDFTSVGGACSSGGSWNNGTYSRTMVRANASWANDPPLAYCLSSTFTAASTLWFHSYYAWVFSSATNGSQDVGFYGSDGVPRLLLRETSTEGVFKLSTRNAAGVITDLFTFGNCPHEGPGQMDLAINYSTSGSATLYCNSVNMGTYTGDITTDGVTQLNQFRLSSVSNSLWFSEIIVATTPTVTMHLATLVPNGNGAVDTFDVGGVSNVNPANINDANVNASSAPGQVQLYTTNSVPGGTFSVPAVCVSLRALVDTTGPQHVQVTIRSGGTNYNSSSYSPPQDMFANLGPACWSTNPNTSGAWSTGTVNSLQLGFTSVP